MHTTTTPGRSFTPWGGTPETMAPEEVAAGGQTSVTTEVDFAWSDSVRPTCGSLRTHNPDPAVCAAKVVNEQVANLRDLAPHVPRSLAQCVGKAMAREARDRFVTPAEFDAALGRLPFVARSWMRTDRARPSGHAACWRGQESGRSDATVCAVPAGKRTEVVAQHQPSGRRITGACRAPGNGLCAPAVSVGPPSRPSPEHAWTRIAGAIIMQEGPAWRSLAAHCRARMPWARGTILRPRRDSSAGRARD